MCVVFLLVSRHSKIICAVPPFLVADVSGATRPTRQASDSHSAPLQSCGALLCSLSMGRNTYLQPTSTVPLEDGLTAIRRWNGNRTNHSGVQAGISPHCPSMPHARCAARTQLLPMALGWRRQFVYERCGRTSLFAVVVFGLLWGSGGRSSIVDASKIPVGSAHAHACSAMLWFATSFWWVRLVAALASPLRVCKARFQRSRQEILPTFVVPHAFRLQTAFLPSEPAAVWAECSRVFVLVCGHT